MKLGLCHVTVVTLSRLGAARPRTIKPAGNTFKGKSLVIVEPASIQPDWNIAYSIDGAPVVQSHVDDINVEMSRLLSELKVARPWELDNLRPVVHLQQENPVGMLRGLWRFASDSGADTALHTAELKGDDLQDALCVCVQAYDDVEGVQIKDDQFKLGRAQPARQWVALHLRPPQDFLQAQLDSAQDYAQTYQAANLYLEMLREFRCIDLPELATAWDCVQALLPECGVTENWLAAARFARTALDDAALELKLLTELESRLKADTLFPRESPIFSASQMNAHACSALAGYYGKAHPYSQATGDKFTALTQGALAWCCQAPEQSVEEFLTLLETLAETGQRWPSLDAGALSEQFTSQWLGSVADKKVKAALRRKLSSKGQKDRRV
jgi:hypothetical protein